MCQFDEQSRDPLPFRDDVLAPASGSPTPSHGAAAPATPDRASPPAEPQLNPTSDYAALFASIARAFSIEGELETFNLWSSPRDFTNNMETRDACAAVSVLVGEISYPGTAVAEDLWSSFALACANALRHAALDAQGVPRDAIMRPN